jgi:hypothetical protein
MACASLSAALSTSVVSTIVVVGEATVAVVEGVGVGVVAEVFGGASVVGGSSSSDSESASSPEPLVQAAVTRMRARSRHDRTARLQLRSSAFLANHPITFARRLDPQN